MTQGAPRSIGLAGATGVGVGAIVGGGILALAGPAFVAAGPAAVIAFALNGVIAMITAMSFAELATRFPESGGTYAFARRVLALEAAFVVGWVVWFASIVAAVLYAIGFASFAAAAAEEIWTLARGAAPVWLGGRVVTGVIAVGVVGVVSLGLLRRAGGGGEWINVVKLIAFAILIGSGAWAVAQRGATASVEAVRPFLPHGGAGVVTAMGFTFIALQGFDLIAAVGGEVKEPRRNIPRAMVLSLSIALVVYIPLLLVLAAAGADPGVGISELSAAEPATVVAQAARRWLGAAGYWLVLVVGLLAMVSALQANLLAASRVACVMARDRNLPGVLERLSGRGTPSRAVLLTAGIVAAVALAVGEVGAAGAAASLVFLFTFALTHLITMLARRRAGRDAEAFRAPFGPALPALGALCCAALGIYQAVVVPSAGAVIGVWMAVGLGLFVAILGPRSRVRDAAAEAADPRLLLMRGRSPLVLVPVANPAGSSLLAGVAGALMPPAVGRVLFLSIVRSGGGEGADVGPAIAATTSAIGNALLRAHGSGIPTEALITAAPDPWNEVIRVGRTHRCEAILLGMGDMSDPKALAHLDSVAAGTGCDVAVLRAPAGWSIEGCARVLVPVAGRGGHEVFRARVVSRLAARKQSIVYLRVIPPEATREVERRARRHLRLLIADEADGRAEAAVERGAPLETLVKHAREADLVVMGLQRAGRSRMIGDLQQRLAAECDTPLLLISRASGGPRRRGGRG